MPRGRDYGRICFKLLHLRQPVVAAINGWCAAGGVGIALACDILMCSDDAQFYMPQLAYGYPSMPGIGALFMMYTSIAWTKDMILRRRKIDAATAERIGLVSQIVPRDDLEEEAWKAAVELARSARRYHDDAAGDDEQALAERHRHRGRDAGRTPHRHRGAQPSPTGRNARPTGRRSNARPPRA